MLFRSLNIDVDFYQRSLKHLNELNLQEIDIISSQLETNTHYYTVKPSEYNTNCAFCGSPNIVKYGKTMRKLLDLPVRDEKIIINVIVPRYRCNCCNQTFSHTFQFVDKHAKVTKRLREKIEKLFLYRSLSDISQEYNISVSAIERIAMKYIRKQDADRHIILPELLGIDEAHINKNTYGLFVDIKKHKPIELLKNNTYNEMSKFLKSVDYSNVKVVVIDMTPKYKRLINTIIPAAHIVIDKFHIQQDIQKAFRKELAQYDNVILYEIRTLLLYKRESLSYEQQQLLNEYISRYPQVSFIYEIKELLINIYNTTDKDSAEQIIDKASALITADYIFFYHLLKRILYWKQEILNYHDYQYTNAVTEGINKRIVQFNYIGNGYSFPILRAKLLYSY